MGQLIAIPRTHPVCNVVPHICTPKAIVHALTIGKWYTTVLIFSPQKQ
jgi:hypothetical protein